LSRVIIWITVFVNALVILDLDYCCDALLTEGFLIPSVTASNDTGCQVKLMSDN